jgi:methylmalonyl-CoA mutase cobalamin-binding subunit
MSSLRLLARVLHALPLALFFCVIGAAHAAPSVTATSTPYTVAVYYFPGWRIAPPLFHLDPWRKIKPYTEREPLIGWYHDGDDSVTWQQVAQMSEAGINLVIYDWYWLPKEGVALNHAVDSFRRKSNKKDIRYAILWANHSGVPENEDDFYSVVRYWISTYFKEPAYYTVDGHPVVVIFAPIDLDQRAHSFGRSTQELFRGANELAKKAGLPDIYFVAATQATPGRADKLLPDAGYQALTAYNYQRAGGGPQADSARESHSYSELTAGYEESWDWILKNSPLPYWIPVSAGWDKRPWDGSTDSLHDLSESSPESFEVHLRAAKQIVDRNSEKTQHTVVICCWNEYGEGSYIEPTKEYGAKYIDAVRAVFGGVKSGNAK